MSWIIDKNGLGRRSQYMDLAASPPPLVRTSRFRYAAELHRFQGQLCFVLTAKDREFIDCGNSLTFGITDQISALLAVGVEIGVARSWSRERTFSSPSCASCVPVLRLTEATLTKTAYYRRPGRPPTLIKSTLTQGPDCERHYEIDCVPKPECPECSDREEIRPSDLAGTLGGETVGEHVAVTLSVENAEFEPSESRELLDEAMGWLDDVLEPPEIDAAEGLFVQGHGRGLAFLPADLDSASPGRYPVVPLSISRDVERLGGVVVEPGESLPVVLLASHSASVTGWADFIDREDGPVRGGERVELSTDEIGPFSVLAATVPRPESSGSDAKDLVIGVFDETADRSRILRFPVRDMMGDLVPI